MKSYLQRQAKELEHELLLIDPQNGLTPSEMVFLRYYAQGFTPLRSMAFLHDVEVAAGELALTDAQLKNRALKILKKPNSRKYLDKINAKLEEVGVASAQEIQAWLTDAMRCDPEMLAESHPLHQSKTVTVRTTKDGATTTSTKYTIVDKIAAARQLSKMKGWDAPVKVDVKHSGGVMLVPMSGSVDDWEKAATQSQEELMQQTIDI